MDVPEEPAVAIRVVETRIRLELDPASRSREPLELTGRLPCVALALAELGRIDLDETHTLPAAEVEAVTVTDALDGCARALSVLRRLRAARERDGQCEGAYGA